MRSMRPVASRPAGRKRRESILCLDRRATLAVAPDGRALSLAMNTTPEYAALRTRPAATVCSGKHRITAIVRWAGAEPDHQATRVGGGGFIRLRPRPPKSSEHLREDVDRRVVLGFMSEFADDVDVLDDALGIRDKHRPRQKH